MKFKNYRNPYTNDNRIYSKKDLHDMPFGEFIRRKNEVLSQFRVLGVPTEKELRGSDNVVYVEAYTREDGTEVKAHYRSKPDVGSAVSHSTEQKQKTENEQNDNQSSSIGAVTEVKQEEKKQENNQTEVHQNSETIDEQTKDERLYPKEIAGVPRGKEMSFEDVVNKGVNPSYDKTAPEGIDDGNCNSCVAAYLYARRGYDVNAASTLDNEKAEELSHNGLDLWVEPNTGEIAEWTKININQQSSYDYLNNNIKSCEIYELAQYPQLEEGKPETISGHVVVVEKGSDNQLKIYDPQKREVYIDNEQTKMYLEAWIDSPNAVKDIYPNVIRIDNKQINPYYEGVLVH